MPYKTSEIILKQAIKGFSNIDFPININLEKLKAIKNPDIVINAVYLRMFVSFRYYTD